MKNKHAVLLLGSAVISFLLQFIPVSALYHDHTIYQGDGYTLMMGQEGGSIPKEHSVTLFLNSYTYVPSTIWHYVAIVLNYLNLFLVFVISFATKKRSTRLGITYVVAAIWFVLTAMFLFVPFVDVRELSQSPLSYFGIGGQAMLDNAELAPSYVAVGLALTALVFVIVAANNLRQLAAPPE